jgi:hypothetical protein
MIQVGTKLKALYGDDLIDKTTAGNIYEVVEVSEVGFWIVNDEHKVSFPVSTRFLIVQEEC